MKLIEDSGAYHRAPDNPSIGFYFGEHYNQLNMIVDKCDEVEISAGIRRETSIDPKLLT